MKRLIVLPLLLVFGILVLNAATYDHKDGGISIWFPDDWEVEIDGDVMEAEAPDDDAFLQMLVLPDVETMEAAIDIYTRELEGLIKDFRPTGEGQNIKHNGLDVFYIDGDGYIEGVMMDVSVSLVISPTAITMIITFNTKEAAQKYQEDFKGIVNSIKAL
jgi:hypothetical protein